MLGCTGAADLLIWGTEQVSVIPTNQKPVWLFIIRREELSSAILGSVKASEENLLSATGHCCQHLDFGY